MDLNSNIRKLRVNHGLSQIEFGYKIGVSKQCVSNWENDNVLPSIEMLVKIANYFNVSTDYLLGKSELKTLNVEGLTDQQIIHLSQLVNDFRK